MKSALSPPLFFSSLWPVHKSELRKIVPLLILKFLVSISYAILTLLKEPLTIMVKGSGAEVIPVIKGWIVFPLSIACAVGYSKLSNHFKPSTLFYGIISFFLSIAALYAFVLYPYSDILSPTQSANWLIAKLGVRHSHWISIYRYWPHTLFFTIAELWGQVVILTLYWSFANRISCLKEAKRTYTLFIAAGDLGTVIAPMLVLYYTTKHNKLGFSFAPTMQTLVLFILFFGILILFTYWWMQRFVLIDSNENAKRDKDVKGGKTSLSLKQSIKHIFSSKYLLAIAVIVVSISLAMNIVEVTWKAHLKSLYPDPASYQNFIAKQTLCVGIVAFITVFFLGTKLMNRFGWRFSAQIPPIAIGLTSVIFFLLCIFKSSLTPIASFFGITPLFLIVIFGAFQATVNKVTKYSFFDSTKEMVYIPLDRESKVKGKAAIEMVGSRFGKSGSSWIQLLVIEMIGTGSILFASPYLLPIVVLVTSGWIGCISYLNQQLTNRERETAQASSEQVTLDPLEPIKETSVSS